MSLVVLGFIFIVQCHADRPHYDLADQSLQLHNLEGYKVSAFTNIIESKRHIDIVVVKDDTHQTISTLTFNEKDVSYKEIGTYTYSFNETDLSNFKIVGLLPGDFDTDKVTDVMVVFEDVKNLGQYKVSIVWNKNEKFDSATKPFSLSSIPHLIEYNGDDLVDFIAELSEKRYFFINSPNDPGNFTKKVLIPDDPSYEIDYSKRENKYVFADFNGDCEADLVSILPLKEDKKHIIEFFEAGGSKLSRQWSFSIPNEVSATQYGAPLAIDLDGNGKLDIVLAACNGSFVNGQCSDSKILMFYNDPCMPSQADKCSKFQSPGRNFTFELNVNHISSFNKFQNAKELYSFMAYEKDKLFSTSFMLRSVDFDSDGNLDLVSILQYDNQKTVVFFRNVLDKSQVGMRYLEPMWIDEMQTFNKDFEPYAIAPVDAMSNGNPQFFLVGKGKSNPDKFSLDVYTSDNPIFDTFWFKVTVLCLDCDDTSTTMVGSSVFYYTSGVKGKPQVGYGSQNTLLTANSLQPPYVLFGLGEQANYIEYVKVGYRIQRSDGVNHDITQFDSIIPNAQIFAIPRSNGGGWKLAMLVVPGKLLWETLAVLGVCCLVCAIVILALHIKEKKEDDREKRKFNAKFNFSAM